MITRPLFFFCFLAFLTGFADTVHAQNPAKKRTSSHYNEIRTKSPFTNPAPVIQTQATEPPSQLSNWALSGFAEIGAKKVVILQNKTQPSERVMVISGEKNAHNIEILEIQRGKNYLEDKVHLRLAGAVEGWVEYDTQYLKLERPPEPPPQPAEQPQPQPNNNGQQQRRERQQR